MNRSDHAVEAQRILVAHDHRITLDPISDRLSVTMDDAYAIQSIVTAARLARGERVVGWKLGYTSVAMREQMGVAEANHGPLTDAMLIADGADVAGRFTQPRVEPEVALQFGRDVPAGADRAAVLDSVASAHAALEVVDSVWTNYRFRIEDNTADGSSAAGVVLGPQLRLDRIADVRVSLLIDGGVVGIGHGRRRERSPGRRSGLAGRATRCRRRRAAGRRHRHHRRAHVCGRARGGIADQCRVRRRHRR